MQNYTKSEDINIPICHSFREYRAANAHLVLTNIALKTRSLLAIQKERTKPPYNRGQNAKEKQFGKESWINKTINVVKTGFFTSTTRSSRRRSKSSPLYAINMLTTLFTITNVPSLSWTLSSLAMCACEVCCDSAHFTLSRLLLPWLVPSHIAAICEGHLKNKNSGDRQQQPP